MPFAKQLDMGTRLGATHRLKGTVEVDGAYVGGKGVREKLPRAPRIGGLLERGS